ncbi:cellulase family glycosylhydrolase [Glaciecola siphonariae]|uniref:Cellulase family glycosylhydrolase n=1 Tax=Glaciecola siphonariae TaxID=521012 RepID=A0ABV9LZD4_9ALTE
MIQFNAFKLVLLCTFLTLFTMSSMADAARGRVKIDSDNNVVADNGVKLRGAPFFLDIFAISDMKNNDQAYKDYFMSVAKDYNMNLVRCSPWIGNWAYMQKGDIWYEDHKDKISHLIDRCVTWAEEAGIYAVINMHIEFGTTVNLQKSKDFWGLYAGKYKNKTHVIYELVNEPDIPSAKQNMSALYSYVRNLAPNTHLILWSPNNPSALPVADIRNNSSGIDYSNASVGYHIYEYIVGKRVQHDKADEYRDEFPTINTEFYSLTDANYYPIDYEFLVDNIKVMEDRGYSWMQWSPVFNYKNTNQNLDNDDLKFSSTYKNRVKNGYGAASGIGTYWPKDHGLQDDEPTSGVTGKKRIQDGWKGRYLHASANAGWADVQSVDLVPNWGSQKWVIESAGNNTFRIRNVWTGMYLTASSKNEWAPIKIDPLNSSWSSQRWFIEKTGNQYRLKNQWSQQYISSPENQWDVMRQAKLRDTWGSQKFTLSAY